MQSISFEKEATRSVETSGASPGTRPFILIFISQLVFLRLSDRAVYLEQFILYKCTLR